MSSNLSKMILEDFLRHSRPCIEAVVKEMQQFKEKVNPLLIKLSRELGIPLVATKTAPLNSGIDAAERTGVCLVCFVSDDRMSVFAHPERLICPP